jgi:hypothetical protein
MVLTLRGIFLGFYVPIFKAAVSDALLDGCLGSGQKMAGAQDENTPLEIL